jgi:hypothetical protein
VKTTNERLVGAQKDARYLNNSVKTECVEMQRLNIF